MTSQYDWDYQLSGSKISPLDSATKRHFPRDRTGSVGEDFDIEHAHIEPLDSPVKEHAHPMLDGTMGQEQKEKAEVEMKKKAGMKE